MDVLLYDGSWAGMLTAIFEVYEYKFQQPGIYGEQLAPASLFGKTHQVITNQDKAARVTAKLQQKLSLQGFRQLYKNYLSEIAGIENSILRYAQYVIDSPKIVEYNFTHPDVLLIQQTARKVDREKHRMEAFVRFELTKDQLYYALIQPDFNVLPLIVPHFKNRYADQRWLIYDTRRNYGIYYDLQQVTEVLINFDEQMDMPGTHAGIADEHEALYQTLWKQYFKSVNIAARKNTRLHLQHMPKRYWKFLTEKQ